MREGRDVDQRIGAPENQHPWCPGARPSSVWDREVHDGLTLFCQRWGQEEKSPEAQEICAPHAQDQRGARGTEGGARRDARGATHLRPARTGPAWGAWDRRRRETPRRAAIIRPRTKRFTRRQTVHTIGRFHWRHPHGRQRPKCAPGRTRSASACSHAFGSRWSYRHKTQTHRQSLCD